MFIEMQVLIRLSLSVVLGGLIGLERQLHRRTAGLRTHIVVTLGSCLIMLTSVYVFDIYKDQVPLDPARIAAGVITGIGFLGAGAIIQDREKVRGLTTAASLWVAAAIGLAVGCGFYSGAIFTTILVVIVLLVLRYIEGIVLNKIKV
ncbi:MAG: MgtC/SapB family protein [Candidatus Omnitrophica bacterium]|nr:MgtC/SapB family protein [Candidatus Omnitrophota bacterium]MCG2706907.1 MgtC/SapB family protein [Candidatus Omnitrophota bacterium]